MTPLIICCRNNCASENVCFCTKCSVGVIFSEYGCFIISYQDLIIIIVVHLLYDLFLCFKLDETFFFVICRFDLI